MEADLGVDLLRPELLDAGSAARTSEVGIEAVAMPVSVALDLHAGAREEPGSEDPICADAELIESEVDPRRLRRDGSAARELRHHLDARVVVRGAHEEAGEPDASHLQSGSGSLPAVEGDLALLSRGGKGNAADETKQRARAHLFLLERNRGTGGAGRRDRVLRIARAEEASALRRGDPAAAPAPASRLRAAAGGNARVRRRLADMPVQAARGSGCRRSRHTSSAVAGSRRPRARACTRGTGTSRRPCGGDSSRKRLRAR